LTTISVAGSSQLLGLGVEERLDLLQVIEIDHGDFGAQQLVKEEVALQLPPPRAGSSPAPARAASADG
jgi:hypothetical protein